MISWRHWFLMLLLAGAAGCGKSADDRADLGMSGAVDMSMSIPENADLTRSDTDGAGVPDLAVTLDIAMPMPDAGPDSARPLPDLPSADARPGLEPPICIFDDNMSRFDDRCVFGP